MIVNVGGGLLWGRYGIESVMRKASNGSVLATQPRVLRLGTRGCLGILKKLNKNVLKRVNGSLASGLFSSVSYLITQSKTGSLGHPDWVARSGWHPTVGSPLAPRLGPSLGAKLQNGCHVGFADARNLTKTLVSWASALHVLQMFLRQTQAKQQRCAVRRNLCVGNIHVLMVELKEGFATIVGRFKGDQHVIMTQHQFKQTPGQWIASVTDWAIRITDFISFIG